jgi:hypothetical protein
LTIVLFAELPATLSRHADRMNALLGEPRVIDDPRLYGSVLLDHRKNMSAHLSQHRFIGPLGLRNEMVERLIRSLDTTGIDTRGNRFDALAFARKDQAGAIGTKRRYTILSASKPFRFTTPSESSVNLRNILFPSL